MKEEHERNRLRLKLTGRQKEQIWKATGRRVNALDLGLRQHDPGAEPVPSPGPATRSADRKDEGSAA